VRVHTRKRGLRCTCAQQPRWVCLGRSDSIGELQGAATHAHGEAKCYPQTRARVCTRAITHTHTHKYTHKQTQRVRCRRRGVERRGEANLHAAEPAIPLELVPELDRRAHLCRQNKMSALVCAGATSAGGARRGKMMHAGHLLRLIRNGLDQLLHGVQFLRPAPCACTRQVLSNAPPRLRFARSASNNALELRAPHL